MIVEHSHPLLPGPLKDQRVHGLLAVLGPALRRARADLAAGLREAEAAFSAPLCERAMSMIDRVMVVELHRAKARGELRGETPEARFDDFVRRLLEEPDRVAAIRARSPVLFARVERAIRDGVAFALELDAHLTEDRADISRRFFDGRDPGPVRRLQMSGDRHRRGRAVTILTFDDGSRLVYKPRPLAAEAAYGELVADLGLDLLAAPVLEREGYGWMQHLRPADCADRAAVARFYRRQGAHLALAHAIGATDLHGENVMACGEHPVLIDLEACLQPDQHPPETGRSWVRAGMELGDSVIGTGLVPARSVFGARDPGLDISGLGAAPGQRSKVRVPFWDRAGTDEMRLVRRPMELPGTHNRPTLDGRPVDVLEHLDDVKAGFTDAYRRVVARGRALPLEAFARAPARVLIRGTNLYAKMAMESFHPDFAADEARLRGFLDKLELEVKNDARLAAVVGPEKADLHRGDVPIFTAWPARRDLLASDGSVARGFFVTSGLEVARRRLDGFCEADLARQLWFLEASILALRAAPTPSAPPPAAPSSGGAAEAVSLASQIGDRLADLAVRCGDNATWIGVEPNDDDHFVLGPLGLDLYDGLSGVVLFLAHLARVSGEARHLELARASARTLVRQLEDEQGYFTGVGGFAGWGGVVWALSHLAVLWDDAALGAAADGLAARMADLVEVASDPGLLSGLAGCVASLIASGRRRDVALRAADRLRATAVPQPGGLGWVEHAVALHGFSHGASGIGWALCKTGRPEDRAVAEAAFGFEAHGFCPQAGNWPDLRETDEDFACLWCHGAPGVVLSRLDLGRWDAQVEAGLETVRRQGFGLNHCLCHGDLGNLEVLRAAARRGHPGAAEDAERVLGVVLASVRARPCTGVRGGIESPGLMTGLAGIGYGLLRAARPDGVPNALLLEPVG